MTILERVYYTIASVHSLLHYIVSLTYTKFVYMDMATASKYLLKCRKQPVCVETAYHIILQLYMLLTFKCITTYCRTIIRQWAAKIPPQNEVYRL